VILYISAVD